MMRSLPSLHRASEDLLHLSNDQAGAMAQGDGGHDGHKGDDGVEANSVS